MEGASRVGRIKDVFGNDIIVNLDLTRKDIKKYVASLNVSGRFNAVELETMQTHSENMWDNEERKGELTKFKKDLLSLFEDMKKYPDLADICFDSMAVDATDYQDVFSCFFAARKMYIQYTPHYVYLELDKLENSAFSNDTRGVGGALYIDSIPATVDNSSFAGNSAWLD